MKRKFACVYSNLYVLFLFILQKRTQWSSSGPSGCVYQVPLGRIVRSRPKALLLMDRYERACALTSGRDPNLAMASEGQECAQISG